MLESKIFNIILLCTLIGEFVLPWILKHFYQGYDSKKMVMSALGSPESPVRKVYNVWLVWLGVFLLVTSFAIFPEIKKISVVLAVLSFLSIAVFAVGASILAGIFSVNESKEVVTTASKVHGADSAIGFMLLLFYPSISGVVAFKSNSSFIIGEKIWN